MQGIVTPPRTVQTPDPKYQSTQEHFEEKNLNIEYLNGPKLLLISFQSWANHYSLWKIVPLPRQ